MNPQVVDYDRRGCRYGNKKSSFRLGETYRMPFIDLALDVRIWERARVTLQRNAKGALQILDRADTAQLSASLEDYWAYMRKRSRYSLKGRRRVR